jgi:hypothetical protein
MKCLGAVGCNHYLKDMEWDKQFGKNELQNFPSGHFIINLEI